MVAHHEVYETHIAFFQLLVGLLDVENVAEDGHFGGVCSEEVDGLNPRSFIDHALLSPRHVGNHHDLGSGIVQQAYLFGEPLVELLGGQQLDEDGGLRKFSDHIEQELPLVGLVVDPDDEVGVGGRQLAFRFDFVHFVHGEGVFQVGVFWVRINDVLLLAGD